MPFSSFVPFSFLVSKALLSLPHLTKMRASFNKITHILITDRIGRHKFTLKTSNQNFNYLFHESRSE